MSDLKDIHSSYTNLTHFIPNEETEPDKHYITLRTYRKVVVNVGTEAEPQYEIQLEPIVKTFWIYLLHNHSVDKKALELIHANAEGKPRDQ